MPYSFPVTPSTSAIMDIASMPYSFIRYAFEAPCTNVSFRPIRYSFFPRPASAMHSATMLPRPPMMLWFSKVMQPYLLFAIASMISG